MKGDKHAPLPPPKNSNNNNEFEEEEKSRKEKATPHLGTEESSPS
jgi:hypothetical protein